MDRNHAYRVSQDGKQPKVFSFLDDALDCGDLLHADNPYDPVLFESKMQGMFVSCGKIEPTSTRRPDNIWRGAVFGLYYVVGDDGKTREALWEEVEQQREAAVLGRGSEPIDLRERLRESERRYITEALKACRWKVSQAAKQLKLPRRTLIDRMTILGINTPKDTVAQEDSAAQAA